MQVIKEKGKEAFLKFLMFTVQAKVTHIKFFYDNLNVTNQIFSILTQGFSVFGTESDLYLIFFKAIVF